MASAVKKSFDSPDETRKFDKGQVDIANLPGGPVGRYRFDPGWKWSECVKPIAGTDLCEVEHYDYQLTGVLHIRMADGTEMEFGPGDVSHIPAGHDAWVVGNEAVTGIDWAGMDNYAKQ
jgi:hypothetical protein